MRSQHPEVVTLAKGTSNAHVKKIPFRASLDSCWLNYLATGAGFSPKKETISMMNGIWEGSTLVLYLASPGFMNERPPPYLIRDVIEIRWPISHARSNERDTLMWLWVQLPSLPFSGVVLSTYKWFLIVCPRIQLVPVFPHFDVDLRLKDNRPFPSSSMFADGGRGICLKISFLRHLYQDHS